MKITLATIALVFGLLLSAHADDAPEQPTSHSPAIAAGLTSVKITSPGKAWPHEGSDLKPDARIVWGKLPNGLRYAILPTSAAPTRASLRLYMDVGSLMEKDDQRGLAHFLEHMAFNGTKHFPSGQIDEHFQRLGMKSGADTNATTTFDKTVYQLELRRANEELMDDGLTLFRDFLDGMLLDEKQIDRERGVILSEIVYRDSAQTRAIRAGLQFLVSDSLLAQRWPVGTAASVRALKKQQFVDFYETWYTPARATVVAVGDFDLKMVERLIRDRFHDAIARRGEQQNPTFGKVAATQNEAAKLYTDAELQTVSVELNNVAPAPAVLDSLAHQRDEVVRGLALAMLNARFERLATNENSAIKAASANSHILFNLAEVTTISATCRPVNYKAALGIVEQELRSALSNGFSDDELNEAKTSIVAMLQAIAERADTQQPADLANELVDSLAKNEVNIAAADAVTILKPMLGEITKENCQTALRALWNLGQVKLWIEGDLKLEGDATQQILEAYHASQKTKITATERAATGKFAYIDFGPEGKIVSRNDQPDLGIIEGVFANNVRINIRQTAFEKNTVRVLVRFGGGMLELPADRVGLKLLANDAFIAGGLQAHSLTDLGRLTADKKFGVVFSVGDDAFQLGGPCTPDCIDTELQVCAAYLTAPGYRAEARKQFLDKLDSIYGNVEHTAEGAVGTFGSEFIHGSDARFGLPKRESLEKLTLDDLKAWLTHPLANSYLEISIVGDIDPEVALAKVAKTLGALPMRDAAKPEFKQERAIKFPAGLTSKEITFTSQATRAMSVVCWPTTGSRDIPLSRRIDVLAAILNDRLRIKVREELGATYTPAVTNDDSQTFRDFGCLEADLVVEANQLPQIGQLVSSIASKLATGGISDDEFDRAVRPILTSLDERVKNNSYWLTTICDCQEHPEALDVTRQSAADYRSITKAEIEAIAKRFLTDDKATVISVRPNSAAPTIVPASFSSKN